MYLLCILFVTGIRNQKINFPTCNSIKGYSKQGKDENKLKVTK